MAGLAGIDFEFPGQDLFKRYAQIVEPAAYPEIEELKNSFGEIGNLLTERLDHITDEELDASSPKDFPVADKSVRGGLAFLAWHEAYHVGQMGFLRKWLGFQSLVG
jgi:hypothetical protein